MRNWIPVFCVRAELQTHQQPLLYGCVSQPWGHKPTGDCLEFKWGPLKCLVINFFLFADQIFFNYFLFKIIFMTNKMHTKISHQLTLQSCDCTNDQYQNVSLVARNLCLCFVIANQKVWEPLSYSLNGGQRMSFKKKSKLVVCFSTTFPAVPVASQ